MKKISSGLLFTDLSFIRIDSSTLPGILLLSTGLLFFYILLIWIFLFFLSYYPKVCFSLMSLIIQRFGFLIIQRFAFLCQNSTPDFWSKVYAEPGF